MKNVLFMAITTLLSLKSIYATPKCISFDKALNVAQTELSKYEKVGFRVEDQYDYGYSYLSVPVEDLLESFSEVNFFNDHYSSNVIIDGYTEWQMSVDCDGEFSLSLDADYPSNESIYDFD